MRFWKETESNSWSKFIISSDTLAFYIFYSCTTYFFIFPVYPFLLFWLHISACTMLIIMKSTNLMIHSSLFLCWHLKMKKNTGRTKNGITLLGNIIAFKRYILMLMPANVKFHSLSAVKRWWSHFYWEKKTAEKRYWRKVTQILFS